MEDQLKECEDQTQCRCGYRPHATMGENKVEITKTE